MIYVYRCMIVPSAFTPLAKALCAGLTPGSSGANMFERAISTTGNEPAEYFISSGPIEDTFAALLPLTTFDTEGNSVDTAGHPETIVALAQGMVTLEQIHALLAAIDVSDQDPFGALSRLGLKLI